MRRLSILLLGLALLPVPGPLCADEVEPEEARPIIVQLKDGSRIVGRIVLEECSDQSLVLRQVRTEAKKTIPWEDVLPEAATQLRIQLGFEVAEASGGLRMEGHSIKNRAGIIFVGLLRNEATAEGDGEYVLKTADGERRIRLEDVREGPEAVEVDSLTVYTPLELYERRRKEKAPESAEDHFRLAEFSRLVGALDQAKLHYETVISLADAKYPQAQMERLLARVMKRLGSREIDTALAEIKRAIVYNSFDRAAELITQFKAKYADDEDLQKEAADREQELAEKRADYYKRVVPRFLRDKVRDLLAKKAREEELTMRQAQQYAGAEVSAENGVSNAAVKEVAERLAITPEDLLKYWNDRSKGTPNKAFYRDGTFIVVDNLKDALAEAPKIKGDKNNKGPKPPKPTPPKTPDKWWEGKREGRKYSDLRDWLFAWWAEKSGMVELIEPKEETCPTCTGKGYTQSMHTTPQGSVPFFNRCQNCHMAKFWRVVRFK